MRIKRRAAKGEGRLYKRGTDGKEYPPENNAALPFWLSYSIPNPKGGTGERIRMALRDPDGNPITDRKQAEKERRRILAPYKTGDQLETLKQIAFKVGALELEHKKAVDESEAPLSIKEVWAQFKAKYKNVDRGGDVTLHQYEGHWQRFENWLGQEYPNIRYLREVTDLMALKYAANLTEAKLSGNRFNKHINFLKKLFRDLFKIARLTVNPFTDIESRTIRPHSRRALTIAELMTILDEAEGDLALLLLIGATTGLRLGDCSTLTWDNINLKSGIISRLPNKIARRKDAQPVMLGLTPALREKLLEIPEKDRNGYVLPKIAAQYIKDSPTVTDAIKAHILNCGIDVHAPGTGEQIRRNKDGAPERDKVGKVILIDTGKRAVVNVGFHSLRHTWVSMHAAKGTPQSLVQASVGHKNPAMTQYYTHIQEDTARKLALALPEFIGGKPAETRDPLPGWAIALVEKLSLKNVKEIKAELLRGAK